MKKILAIIALTIVFGMNSLNSNAQNSAITGQIIETENYSPVNTAVISLSNANTSFRQNVISNENGLFELDGIPAGNYRMTVFMSGFQKAVYNVSVKDGMTDMGIIEITEDRLYSQNTEKKANKHNSK